MIVDQDVDDFLEHFGVKGQRWGVRRKQKATQGTQSKRGGRTTAQQKTHDRNVKIAGGTATVAAGAVFAAVLIKRSQNKKISTIVRPASMYNYHSGPFANANRLRDGLQPLASLR